MNDASNALNAAVAAQNQTAAESVAENPTDATANPQSNSTKTDGGGVVGLATDSGTSAGETISGPLAPLSTDAVAATGLSTSSMASAQTDGATANSVTGPTLLSKPALVAGLEGVEIKSYGFHLIDCVVDTATKDVEVIKAAARRVVEATERAEHWTIDEVRVLCQKVRSEL